MDIIISKFKSCFERNDYVQLPIETTKLTNEGLRELVEKIDKLLADLSRLNTENVKDIADHYIKIFMHSPSESRKLIPQIRKFSRYQEKGEYLKLREVFCNIIGKHQKKIKDKLLKECLDVQCMSMGF